MMPGEKTTRLQFSDSEPVLRNFYKSKGLLPAFNVDYLYLKKAFEHINLLWLNNFEKIDTARFLMIGEAPLWGIHNKYIYNPETKNTQFFYRSDLGDVIGQELADKKIFIHACNKAGLLMIDISPFPLNPHNTRFNYNKNTSQSIKLSPGEYKKIVGDTLPAYFEKKLKMIRVKKHPEAKVFFRYARVKDAFIDLVTPALIINGFIRSANEIGDISQVGGGINKKEFGNIIQTLQT
jgi:hypothetical protein